MNKNYNSVRWRQDPLMISCQFENSTFNSLLACTSINKCWKSGANTVVFTIMPNTWLMGKRSISNFVSDAFSTNRRKIRQIMKPCSRHLKFTYPLMPAYRRIKAIGEFFLVISSAISATFQVKMKTDTVPYVFRRVFSIYKSYHTIKDGHKFGHTWCFLWVPKLSVPGLSSDRL